MEELKRNERIKSEISKKEIEKERKMELLAKKKALIDEMERKNARFKIPKNSSTADGSGRKKLTNGNDAPIKQCRDYVNDERGFGGIDRVSNRDTPTSGPSAATVQAYLDKKKRQSLEQSEKMKIEKERIIKNRIERAGYKVSLSWLFCELHVSPLNNVFYIFM